MQTFLPYAEFFKTAECLDDKRLGNQCYRETVTLIRGGWPNHPAAKMWKGYESMLACYGRTLADEIRSRGVREEDEAKIATGEKWIKFFFAAEDYFFDGTFMAPPWLGDEEFHRSHRSNLLRKDPEWYGQFGWDVPDDLPYVWPEVLPDLSSCTTP